MSLEVALPCQALVLEAPLDLRKVRLRRGEVAGDLQNEFGGLVLHLIESHHVFTYLLEESALHLIALDLFAVPVLVEAAISEALALSLLKLEADPLNGRICHCSGSAL